MHGHEMNDVAQESNNKNRHQTGRTHTQTDSTGNISITHYGRNNYWIVFENIGHVI